MTIIRTHQLPEPGSRARYDSLVAQMGIADRMTKVGWHLDREVAKKHMWRCEERYEIYRDKFLAFSGLPAAVLGKLGVGQTSKVRKWFFETNQSPVVSIDKHTKNAQLNSATLVEYATRYKDTSYGPAAAALYALRKNKKYISYCRAYLVHSAADGRVHCNFFPWGTKTGRWSSGSKLYVREENALVKYGLNLQQVPQQAPEFDFGAGKVPLVESLRDCFIADDDCMMGSADYSALEMRLIAYIFNVKRIIELLDLEDAGQSVDIHWVTARALFVELNLPEVYDEKNKLQKAARNCAKSCTYGLSYQYCEQTSEGKWPTLQKTLSTFFPNLINQQFMTKLADRFFTLYPEILDGQKEVRDQVDGLGCRIIAIDGRRLMYPSSNRGYNQGTNATFQSPGAVLIGRAMVSLDDHCDWRVGGFYMQGQIHDELVFNLPKNEIEARKFLIEQAMSVPANFGQVTKGIPAKLKIGDSWPK